jgi:hypothetical protein
MEQSLGLIQDSWEHPGRGFGIGTPSAFLANSYRVLLTRAREGLILWRPSGDESDPTRCPGLLDATVAFFTRCGAAPIAVSSRP